MGTADRIAYMADQIARNFAAIGHERAVAATADHIATFWDPAMRARGLALLDDGALSPAAAAAFALLRESGAPAHQTAATEFNAVNHGGHSDAG